MPFGVIALWGLRLVLATALSAVLLGAALYTDAWRVQESFAAPFAHEFGDETKALAVQLGKFLPFPRLFATDGDTPSQLHRSSLRILAGDCQLGPAHAEHEVVRKQGGGAYSHWGNHLLFSLPDGIANSPGTQISVEYSIRLEPTLLTTAWITLLVAALVLGWRLRRRDEPRFERYLGSAVVVVSRALQVAIGAIGALAAIYLASIVYGVLAGFALPSTAIFMLAPWTESLARHEPAFPYGLLLLGMAGAILSWVAVLSDGAAASYRRQESRLLRLWHAALPVLVLAAFFFSISGQWGGIYRPEDLVDSAIGGLVPFSDAGGHFSGPYRQAMDGEWNDWVLRRPFAAATKTLLAFSSGYSATWTILLQVVALAVATFVATRAVTRWRGVWAGMTFLALLLVLVRPYLPTHLTEPWGIFWAMVAVPFLIDGLRPNQGPTRILGLLAVTLSLLTRLGSMFTIPALAAWTLWANHRDGIRPWRSFAAVGVSLALLVALNAGLARLYGTNASTTGANFAHSLCGLAHGGTWKVCESLYAEDFANARTQAAGAEIRFDKALAKFKQDPWTLVNRLAEGERHFVQNLPEVVLYGPSVTDQPALFPKNLWYIVCAVGVFWVLSRGRERHELSFWIWMTLGLLGSAPWVIFDEGWRVLSGALVFVALLAASGFSSPLSGVKQGSDALLNRVSWRGFGAFAVVLSLLVTIPALAYRWDALGVRDLSRDSLKPDEALVLGGRHAAAFLVIPDGASLPRAVPAIHFSDFSKGVRASDIEQYQTLLVPGLEGREFAFVMSPGPDQPGKIFITPPEVLLRRDVRVWRFQLAKGDILQGPYFWLVEETEPIMIEPP